MVSSLRLTRDQIRRIVGNDPRAVRQFEALFGETDANAVTIEGAFGLAANADAKANAVLAQLLALMVASLADVDVTGAAAGMVLIYDATAQVWTAANLTAGANITITNGDGSISIAVAGADGTFTTVDGKTVTVADGVITSIV